MLLCKICIARRLVVDIFPWCNAHYVPFPSGTLVARRMGNGSIMLFQASSGLLSQLNPHIIGLNCDYLLFSRKMALSKPHSFNVIESIFNLVHMLL